MATIKQARALGIEHGAANMAPYGDLDDAGSALLVDALGETSPTTARNHLRRAGLIKAYEAGQLDARNVGRMCVRDNAGPGAACWEYQAGEAPVRLSFSIKVF